jgi:hypothetical protein
LILEAFAEYLQTADPKLPATDVLARWLWKHLSSPPLTKVDRVLHCEMTISEMTESTNANYAKMARPKKRISYVFRGKSPSGRRLLRSLYEYCQSYDQQKWSRWVHKLKASDFSERLLGR